VHKLKLLAKVLLYKTLSGVTAT